MRRLFHVTIPTGIVVLHTFSIFLGAHAKIIGNELEDKFRMTISSGIVIFYPVTKTD
jgi:hypothetical protein